MQFDSWSAFWAMGGYGFFVWLAFGISLLALIGLILQSRLARKHVLRALLDEQKRQARIQASRHQQQGSKL
ncbi:heme exporter protein CcmD [Lacimicrobium alkaliphilum]|uniref:Heme exporter protein D n=1 Tax=Lacimicrobium alkaliphilum TaxID=1526571 RepID=A0ABQ1RND3_9ALTE|nr:heme exporter protein CcmD [Lacimicrobium alkaliphilum]GGD72674.1 heme exporter protein D [Lacimicrobium alkaliphilum]